MKILFLLFFTLTLYANERIVTLSPAINEIVFALGAGNEVVGTTEYARYPDAARKLPKVGGYFSPDLEKIAALRPTLVMMQPNNRKLRRALEALEIDVLEVRIDRLAHIYDAVEKLGSRLRREKAAERIVRKIRAALRDIGGIVKDKKILIVFGYYPRIVGNIFVAGQNLYFDDIIAASGNTNALHSARKGQPVLDRENIIALDPDIVVILAHDLRQRGIDKKAVVAPWRTLPIVAAKKGDIYLIDKDYGGIPSDRLVYFLHDFKEILRAAATH